MKRIVTSHLLVSAIITLFSPTASLSDGASFNTLTADFIMTRKVAVLKEALTSKGRLMLAGKGRLRWETTSPGKSVVIINGPKGWLHYPDLDVTKPFDNTSDPVMKLISEQLFALTSGDLRGLTSLYDIAATAPGRKTLTPKDPNISKLFKKLQVEMSQGGVISKVTLISANGDTTAISFENTVKNSRLENALFSAPSKGSQNR